jgi:hypothetical protein
MECLRLYGDMRLIANAGVAHGAKAVVVALVKMETYAAMPMSEHRGWRNASEQYLQSFRTYLAAARKELGVDDLGVR